MTGNMALTTAISPAGRLSRGARWRRRGRATRCSSASRGRNEPTNRNLFRITKRPAMAAQTSQDLGAGRMDVPKLRGEVENAPRPSPRLPPGLTAVGVFGSRTHNDMRRLPRKRTCHQGHVLRRRGGRHASSLEPCPFVDSGQADRKNRAARLASRKDGICTFLPHLTSSRYRDTMQRVSSEQDIASSF